MSLKLEFLCQIVVAMAHAIRMMVRFWFWKLCEYQPYSLSTELESKYFYSRVGSRGRIRKICFLRNLWMGQICFTAIDLSVLSRTERSSLLVRGVSDEDESKTSASARRNASATSAASWRGTEPAPTRRHSSEDRCQTYKTFYGRNL